MPVRFAGHSHWQNVKNIKAEKDDKKQKIINRIVQRIRCAVRGWYFFSIHMFSCN